MKRYFFFLIFAPILSYSQICGFNEEISDDSVTYVEQLCGGYILPENKSNYDINYRIPLEDKNSDVIAMKKHKGAVEVVKEIIDSYGVKGRFILQSCENVNNAYAETKNGIRYIIYDEEFMNDIEYGFGDITMYNREQISDNTYINLFILAHEIAHHIQGHTLNAVDYIPNSDKKIIELEADSWAGFVMQRLGLSIEQASMAINKIVPEEKDDTNLRYPSKSKRLKAIEEGYNNSINQKGEFELAYNWNHYYRSGIGYYLKKNYHKAIEQYSIAIELFKKNKPDIYDQVLLKIYAARAQCRRLLSLHEKAIEDGNFILSIDPNNTDGKYELAQSYYALSNYKEAYLNYFSVYLDLNKSIEEGLSYSIDSIYVTEKWDGFSKSYEEALFMRPVVQYFLATAADDIDFKYEKTNVRASIRHYTDLILWLEKYKFPVYDKFSKIDHKFINNIREKDMYWYLESILSLGDIYYLKENNLDLAEKFYKKILYVFDKYNWESKNLEAEQEIQSNAINLLGTILLHKKEYEKAFDIYNNFTSNNPKNIWGYWGLAEGYHEINDYQNGYKTMKRVLELYQENKNQDVNLIHILGRLAFYSFESEKYDEAIDYNTQMIESQNIHYGILHWSRGNTKYRAYEKTKNLSYLFSSLGDLQFAIEKGPNLYEVLIDLAKVKMKFGQKNEAIKDLDLILKKFKEGSLIFIKDFNKDLDINTLTEKIDFVRTM